MQAARIAELLAPFLGEDQLVEADLKHISMYIDILLRWNARVNLTAIRDPEQIVTRHFGESLFAARHLFPGRKIAEHNAGSPFPDAEGRGPGVKVADLGSGAGFPGIPMKLWAPSISLTLIESNHKKAAFLHEIARSLTLMDIDIQNTRAETLASHQFDVVTLRAVERFASTLPVAAGLLHPTGQLALLIGAPQQAIVHTSLKNLLWSSSIPIPLSTSRVLLIGRARAAIDSNALST